ncbi:MAG: glycerophosphodiester phosphodiesterase [Ilumatobacteraceae bacterium]|nr:glycerophosphodiester phosphodiesterase [Ilumatobacteraceae bacterium]
METARCRWTACAVLAIGSAVLAGCATAGGLTAARLIARPDPNPFRIGRPLVIPHGGGDGLYPEDTLYAYQHSIPAGGDVVDIDVLLSADDIPIAFHDGTLDRTTDGHGAVETKTYAQLSTFDAGYQFTTDGSTHPFRGRGLRIPSVESVLLAFPHTLATLDLKDLRVAAVAPLCTLLERLNRTKDVYIGVDAAAQVAEFRRVCPEVRTSGTDAERAAQRAARAAGDTSFVSHQLVAQPEYIGSDGARRVTADSLSFAHRSDTAVLTWVVDDTADMTTLIDLGVDGIYTRRPDVLVALMRRMGILGS